MPSSGKNCSTDMDSRNAGMSRMNPHHQSMKLSADEDPESISFSSWVASARYPRVRALSMENIKLGYKVASVKDAGAMTSDIWIIPHV